MNYVELVEKKTYFIDKTEYISKLENIANPVFLLPADSANPSSVLCSSITMISKNLIDLSNFLDTLGLDDPLPGNKIHILFLN
jgi:hypothetical protein